MRSTWRLVYGITLLGGAVGAATIVQSLHSGDPTTAVGGLAVLFTCLMTFRTVYEQASLRRARRALGDQERLLQAERGVLERDTDRTRRELADQEREQAATLASERAELREAVEAERDRMNTKYANKKAEWQRSAFRKGFEMGQSGVGKEARDAEVIYLPFSADRPTTMETGTMLN